MITKTCIFFDLDGTLIDVRSRYYEAHVQACKLINISSIPQEAYWQAKRKQIPESELISINDNLLQKYSNARIKLLEDKRLLAMDTVFPGVETLLKQLKDQNILLFIATMRRNTPHALRQITHLHLSQYFNDILSQSPEEDPAASKTALIETQEQIYTNSRRKYIIGDTETDILCGKKLGFTTIAVSSGIRTPKLLEKMDPDYLIDYVTDLPTILRSDGISTV